MGVGVDMICSSRGRRIRLRGPG